MSFAHYEFEEGAWIHAHAHDQEEVWHVIEGELEVTIKGVTKRAGPGAAAIVPANTMHKITALTAGKAIVVDYPLREIAEPAAKFPAPGIKSNKRKMKRPAAGDRVPPAASRARVRRREL